MPFPWCFFCRTLIKFLETFVFLWSSGMWINCLNLINIRTLLHYMRNILLLCYKILSHLRLIVFRVRVVQVYIWKLSAGSCKYIILSVIFWGLSCNARERRFVLHIISTLCLTSIPFLFLNPQPFCFKKLGWDRNEYDDTFLGKNDI